jgi:hypothetical protein
MMGNGRRGRHQDHGQCNQRKTNEMCVHEWLSPDADCSRTR